MSHDTCFTIIWDVELDGFNSHFHIWSKDMSDLGLGGKILKL